MKTLTRIGFFSAMLALPISASAQTDATPQADAAPKAAGMMMNCPMMTDMGSMQKDFGVMMSDVEGMMRDTKDPATKEALQKMHDRMAVMMVNMQKVGGMGGRMPPGNRQPGSSAPTAPATPPASPEDHQAHHPGQ